MNKKELKAGMQNIFSVLEGDSTKKAIENPMFKYLESKSEWFGDPEEMNLMIIDQFMRIVEEMVKKTLNTNDYLVIDIYNYWNFFDNNVTEMCNRFYGAMGCADKGRFILNATIKFRLTGDLPVFKDTYYMPKSGTPMQWIKLVEGLGRLRQGDPNRYLTALRDLGRVHDEATEKLSKKEKD